MKKKYLVIQSRKSDYPEPIVLRQGDDVKIDRVSSEKDGWKDWVYCEHNDLSGWVPKQIIKPNGDGRGLVTEDYSACELDVCIDEIVVSEKEMNGWVWGFKEKEEKSKGWVPLENIKLIKSND